METGKKPAAGAGEQTVASSESTTVAVTIEVPKVRLANLLCSAFEGGVGYWCRIDEYRAPRAPVAYLFPLGGRISAGQICTYADYPLCEGGAVLCYDHSDGMTDQKINRAIKRGEDPRLSLDLLAISRGLALMAKVAPKQLAALLANDGDAMTGDVFVQLCLLGELRYG